uniref:Protein kinase domain-containing protein n=1 Tax=Aegilops tauschii subsp. strangulata TaxID=200361 RepID=A0A453QDA9_AEGTS
IWMMMTMTMMMLLLLAAASSQLAGGEQAPPMTISPRCLAECGNLKIPYPFGTGPGCFLGGFEVICNHTFFPPRLFLVHSLDDHTYAQEVFTSGTYSTDDIEHTSNMSEWDTMRMEIMDISVSRAELRLYAAVSSDCGIRPPYHSFTHVTTRLHPEGPFLISAIRNVLIGVGLNVEVQLSTSMRGSYGGLITGCISQPNSTIAAKEGPCSGLGCCEAAFPEGLWQATVVADRKRTDWYTSENVICSFGMLVEKGWYNYSSEDVYGDEYCLSKKYPKGVPQVLSFAVGNLSCPRQGQRPPQGYACLSGNSSCVDASNRTGYVCKCLKHYDGNPYIRGAGGCQDIDECQLREHYSKLRKKYPCSIGGICKNKIGGYDCPCKPGMKGDGRTGTCTEKFPVPAKMAVGVVGGISIIVVLVLFAFYVSEKKRMREFFIRNGGPMLEKTNNIKIYKEEELRRITKNYSHILGSGAFGVVYMGFLDDKQRIAVKKSKNTDKTQIDQFTNEVIIQSRVIHKNIVRLMGCCLEVDVPILVYEFVANGSLEDLLHDKHRVPLTIDQRLAIAAESAEGLAYMHAKTSTNIQHGDVKPANILLDDNFMPKISDFGISRLIARGNDEHSEEVIGDNNYMDPVYRETGLLTNKSDVYSFGLVLYELITGTKAIGGDNCGYTIYHLGTYTKENRANVTSGRR